VQGLVFAGATLLAAGLLLGLWRGSLRPAMGWGVAASTACLLAVIAGLWLNDQGGALWLLLIPLFLVGVVLLAVVVVGLGFALGTVIRQRRALGWPAFAPLVLYTGAAVATWGAFQVTPLVSRISDEAMIANFARHEAEFQRMVEMAEEDRRFTRIATEFTYPKTPKPTWDLGPAVALLPEARWSEYRALFLAANVPDGISHHDAQISLLYWGSGVLDSTTYLEYVYSPEPPTPLVTSIDGARRSGACGDRCYRQIADSWYLLYWR
jgi:hypothetical protein